MTTRAPEQHVPGAPVQAGPPHHRHTVTVLAATVAFCLGGLSGAWLTAPVEVPAEASGLDRAAEMVEVGAAEPMQLQAVLVVRDLVEAIELGQVGGIRAAFTDDGVWGGYRVDGSDGRGGVEAALASFRQVERFVLSGPVVTPSSVGEGSVAVTVDWAAAGPWGLEAGVDMVEPVTYDVAWDGSMWRVRSSDPWRTLATQRLPPPGD